MASLCDETSLTSMMQTAASLFDDDDEIGNMNNKRRTITTSADDDDDCGGGVWSAIFDKRALIAPDAERIQLLQDRLLMRLREGRGDECIYEVGVAEHTDDAGI